MAGLSTFLNQDSVCPPCNELFKEICEKSPPKETFKLEPKVFIKEAGWIFEGFLLETECNKMIELAENRGFQNADSYCYLYRDRRNDRILVDDTGLSKLMWDRIRPYVSELIVNKKGKSWAPNSVNSRFRVCRYIGGENHYFGRHTDGGYQDPKTGEESFLTLLVYLNSKDEFEGGCTNFFSGPFNEVYQVIPRPGLCTVFYQEDYRCLHEGEKVLKGNKYIIRTDIMFKEIQD